MERLREIRRARQEAGGAKHRRWYTCASADLYVWESASESASESALESALEAFEFCYAKPRAERSLTWSADQGFRHFRIDDGEPSPLVNSTPVAVASEAVDWAAVALTLERFGANIEPRLYRQILKMILKGDSEFHR